MTGGVSIEKYTQLREPYMFRDTVFRIDITHYNNHVNCSEGYDMKTYRKQETHASAQNKAYINSQVCEQFNAHLVKIRTQVGYMTQEHYMLYTRFFLYQLNQQKMLNIETQTHNQKQNAQTNVRYGR
jgi:hypothetical protein